MRFTLLALSFVGAAAQFDFGGGSGGDCSGSGSFNQAISQGSYALVGEIPTGIQGLRIDLTSSADVDIQVVDSASGSLVVDWQGGVLSAATQETKSYSGMSITYSGYNGVGGQPGNEFVEVQGATTTPLTVNAYGYQSGSASVEYSWTGQEGCSGGSGSGPSPSGSGSFSQSISQGSEVDVGTLPAGLTDVYVKLDSSADIDIVLYDGSTKVINYQGGLLNGANFKSLNYKGLNIQYSGYNGEGTDSTLGKEFVYIAGTLPVDLQLKVLGYASGSAAVEYSWGYYSTATSTSSSTLKSQLHDIVDGHQEFSYTACWDHLMRTDQDPNNPDNVLTLYTRRSYAKSNRDSGQNDPDSWNREHVWAKSHGNFGTSQGAGTDIHALRPADRSVNTERSSKDFDNGGTVVPDCNACRETSNSFEAPDEVKGDVARMMFYMAVRWNGDSNSNGLTLTLVNGVGTPYGSSTSGNGQLGDLATLLDWHRNDPVSDEERRRNNIIFDIQGNRNPFIDRPEFVDIIF